MDPATLLLGALIAGASEATKETASQVIKDSYGGLKSMLLNFWGTQTNEPAEADVLLKNLESDVELYRAPVESKIVGFSDAIPQELLLKSEELQNFLEAEGFSQPKYQVSAPNSSGVQIGDNNSQTNNFS